MRKWITYMLLLTFMSINSICVLAEASDTELGNVSYYVDDEGLVNMYIYSGSPINADAVITVFDWENYNAQDYAAMNDDEKSQCIVYSSQVTLKNGVGNCTFGIDGSTGYYPYWISINCVNEKLMGEIAYVAPNDMGITDTVNSIGDVQVLKAYFDENEILILGNNKIYAQLSEDEKIQLCTEVANARPYENSTQILKKVQKWKLDNDLETADSEDIAVILSSFGDVLEINNFPEYQIFATANTAFKSETVVLMEKSSSEFPANFYEAVNLTAMKNTQNYTEIKPLLKRLSASSGCGLDNYFSLSSTKAVDSSLVGKSFNNVNELSDRIKVLISGSGKNVTTGGGGSGGGSGSNGSNQVTVDLSSKALTEHVASEKESVFNDLGGYDWAKPAIDVLQKNGIINGKSSEIFAPSDCITREELIKILVCIFGIHDENAESAFEDVKNHWSESYVASAEKYGVVKGISKSKFGTGEMLTRQDMAVMCYRFMLAFSLKMDIKQVEDFADIGSVSDYAQEAVKVLKGSGVINGRDGNLFVPNDGCNRAEAAKVVYFIYVSKNK